ncbi:GNAT family N-acetyltransferase [Actinocrispum wychmicini]|uniref:RimJ/RimL family protein N-acetyltransferase n=1 Tax=Actinocrispum wychmicini TaxID=1213861 RepID=A0A4R2JU79_9PSEU|nr:GNAT family N-acetyltransferase [Actinocrispum wychmicini]TCO62737.1 RimJ/RimL family protein N-acetyltransferase [Actinocrispum wychmicini]
MFIVKEPIRTERLLLRPFTEDDLEPLYAIQGREDVHEYLYTSPRTRDEVRERLAERVTYTKLAAEGDILLLAVMLGDTLIGDVHLRWVNEEHKQGEVGYVLHPDHRGKGYAAEATRPLIVVGFETLGLHRIAAHMDGRNTASARVVEKLGMRHEAHLVENEFVKGEWTDEVVYAMLARDWVQPHPR